MLKYLNLVVDAIPPVDWSGLDQMADNVVVLRHGWPNNGPIATELAYLE